MRIDASQILAQGGIKVKAGTDSIVGPLKEGDVIRAEVLSGDKGTVVMKTEGGQVFKAKLEADIVLAPGDKVLLEVTGKDKGLSLHYNVADDAPEEATWQSGRPRAAADKSLAPYLAKLAEMNMPVSETAARLMRELTALNPGMTLEEAAFIASNKLTGDEGLMRAALALLASGEKTDAMIARLLMLLTLTETGEPGNLQSAGTTLAEFGVEGRAPEDLMFTDAAPSPGSPSAPAASSALNSAPQAQALIGNSAPQAQTLIGNSAPQTLAGNSAPQAQTLTDLLALILGGTAETGGNHGQGNVSIQPSFPMIIAQDNIIMQSTNVENVQEIIKNGENMLEQRVVNAENSSFILSQIPEPANSASDGRTLGVPGTNENIPGAGTDLSFINSRLSMLLAAIPEFQGAPPQALERFSNMLLRVAAENAITPGGDTEKLEAQLEKLFTRIGKADADAGTRLRIARQELYTRLALIEEAISRAAPPARAEMQEQTHKLMEYVRLLNNIDQFAYMQLPVQFGEDRRAAELYLFKKKGGRKPDPENVNILLALDLEHMGHWESLMNIRKKDVSMQMEVRGEREKEHFRENTVMLHELLAEAGFKLVNTGVTCSKKETTPQTALSSLERHTTGKSGTIDFWI